MEAYAKSLQGIAVRHGISLSSAAQQMLIAPVAEASQYSTFDLDQAVRSTELLLMAMAAEHRGLHNAQSVVRAFAKTPGAIPPFTARG
ncbi:MAG TPA: hypothetical protein VIJ94_13615 [Caulobacteraceae bacterium]